MPSTVAGTWLALCCHSQASPEISTGENQAKECKGGLNQRPKCQFTIKEMQWVQGYFLPLSLAKIMKIGDSPCHGGEARLALDALLERMWTASAFLESHLAMRITFNIQILPGPAILFLGIYPKEIIGKVCKDGGTKMLIVVFFTTAKVGNSIIIHPQRTG